MNENSMLGSTPSVCAFFKLRTPFSFYRVPVDIQIHHKRDNTSSAAPKLRLRDHAVFVLPVDTQHPTHPVSVLIRVLAIYRILLGWKTYKDYMKPTNSPTQGQPNPRKIINRLKVAIGAPFPTARNFSWVGICFI